MEQAISLPKEKAVETEQYSLWQILGIWVAASLPMAILGWIVAPALAPDIAVPLSAQRLPEWGLSPWA
jgi:hypothetical protein